jgi:hypothetical protein
MRVSGSTAQQCRAAVPRSSRGENVTALWGWRDQQEAWAEGVRCRGGGGEGRGGGTAHGPAWNKQAHSRQCTRNSKQAHWPGGVTHDPSAVPHERTCATRIRPAGLLPPPPTRTRTLAHTSLINTAGVAVEQTRPPPHWQQSARAPRHANAPPVAPTHQSWAIQNYCHPGAAGTSCMAGRKGPVPRQRQQSQAQPVVNGYGGRGSCVH